MNRRQALAVSGALLAGALAGCTNDSEPTDEDDTGDANGSDNGNGAGIDDAALETLVSETNNFAFDLYGELLADGTTENLFVSPTSISIALAMTYAGARGTTREQMAETMRYTLDDETLHTAFEELQRRLEDRGTEGESGDSGRDEEEIGRAHV
jgi:serpin B